MAVICSMQACLVASAFAQDSQGGGSSSDKQYGTWWKKSAKAMDPMPEGTLYHLESTLSYTRLSGNVDANMFKGDLMYVVRKNLFTSTTAYSMNATDQTINITVKNAKIDKYNFHEGIGYDLTTRISVGTGFMWERDNSIILDNRFTYYGGGRYGVSVKPPLLLNVGAYVGFEDNTYATGELPQVGFDYPDSYNSMGYRLMNTATFLHFYPKVVLLQTFDFMTYFKDPKYYHWQGALTLQVGIAKGIKLTTRYQARYENALVGEAIQDAFIILRSMTNPKTQEPYKNALVNRDYIFYTGLTFSL